jgi:oxygen-independent coproporphyrinogen-3 oxidase
MPECPPLSLYIHIPWCVRKCPYCDFNSHVSGNGLPEEEYVAALLADLDVDLGAAQGRSLQTIFFGGGTPSLFSPTAIGAILDGVNQRVAFARDIEITLEATPGTTEQQKFHGFRSAGVNRLSIGVQSFNPVHLRHLGRIHDRQQALAAVAQARTAGFDNINLDLMHGLPAQDVADASADLRCAIELAPEHLSWYQLTIEPNTEFFKRPPLLPEDDALAAIQDAGIELLAGAGFAQYEVSAYARGGRRARHNLNYWEFGDYIGIGAGAHGKLTGPDGHIVRTQKTRAPKDYLANRLRNDGERHRAAIDSGELPFEFMMNALRLTDGVPAALFSARTGLPLAIVADQLGRLRQQGLMVPDEKQLAATPLGQRFLNSVIAEFLP